MSNAEPKHIDQESSCNPAWSRTSADYAEHRQPFPSSFFSRLAARGLLVPGRRALDLGTGTGAIALPLAHRGLSVVGVDIAEGQLNEARRRAGKKVAYIRRPAEQTGLETASFDLVFAGQCWHWFDRPRAAAEAARVLAPGGSLIIAHLDWIARPGSVPARTVELANAYGSFVSPKIQERQLNSLYGPWLADLADAGFESIESFSYDVNLRYSHVGWRGRVRASALVGASMPDDRVERFDRDLAAILADDLDPMRVPHRVFAATGVRGPRA
ncbi:MAG: methyltransferase domain-containing protein [Sandaracinaceae bacterium]